MAHLPLVSPVDRLLFLKAQPYLSRQPTEILSTLAAYTEEAYYTAGSEIRARGASVDRILFLAEGQVEVEVDLADPASPQERGVNRIDAPGVVGLLHHFGGYSKGPGVRAVSDTVCIELEVDDLDQILEDHFSLLLQFAERGAEEVRKGQARRAADRRCETGFGEDEMIQTPSSLDLVERLALVRRMPFFAGTNLTVLGELVRFQEPRTFAVGDTLWSLGQRVEDLALVLDGEFQLTNSPSRVMAPAGSTVGAWEILSREPRSEEWVATQPGRALMIRRELFVDLLEDHHDFALAYLRRSSVLTLGSW